MDAAILGKLLGSDGWELLNTLPPYDERNAMKTVMSLRDHGISPELAAAVVTQSRLRTRARSKFGDFADGMLFTADGLEQATRLIVAALHARRYLEAGITTVADLTCGIGADSLAFAGTGLRVLATDLDESTATIARWNLRHFPEAEVRHADGLTLDLNAEGINGIYADPARRVSGPGRAKRRIFDPRAYAPPLDAVWALRETVPAVGVKVGPGIAHDGLPDDAETQWVSVNGDVVEAGLWFGPLAVEGPGRTALLLRTFTDDEGKEHTLSRTMKDEGIEPSVGGIGQYLYEPDGAIIRAGLVGQAAAELNGRLIDSTIAYITTDDPADLPRPTPTAGAQARIATGYRVIDTMPFSLKRLKAYLRDQNVGRLTIKKRGTAVVPEQLRTQLALTGTEEATIVLTRVAGDQQVLFVEPLGTS